MSDDVDSPTSGLLFCWYEAQPEEEVGTRWGQLAGGLHRLITVREELEALRTQRNVEKAMTRLEIHVESYLFRAYELRERALGLLASQTHQAKAVEKLRHPQQRNNALSSLKLTAPELTTAVGNLLSLLDDDIGLRNLHTHKFYLNLVLFTDSDFHDPYDALLDLSNYPSSRRQLEVRLRREIKKTAQYYVGKVEALREAVESVLEAGDPWPRRSPNKGIERAAASTCEQGADLHAPHC